VVAGFVAVEHRYCIRHINLRHNIEKNLENPDSVTFVLVVLTIYVMQGCPVKHSPVRMVVGAAVK